MINYHWRDNPSRWFAPGMGNWGWAWNCCCGGESMFVFAGIDGGAGFVRTDEYDSSDSWTNRANLPTATFAHAVCALNGLGYAIAGLGSTRKTLQYTKPSTTSWATKTDHPTPIRSAFDSAAAVSDKAYLMYGADSTPTFYRDCDEYTPDPSDSWASKTDGPTPARSTGCSAATATDTFYIGGTPGGGPGTAYLQDNDRYTPGSDSWTSRTDLPTPGRRGPYCDILAGLIYVIGGDGGVIGGASDRRDTDEYDPSGDSWTAKTDLPAPGRFLGAISALAGALYAVSGTNAVSSISIVDNDEYVPDTWASKTNITTSHQNGPATTL